MAEFQYGELFAPVGEDDTEFRRLSAEHVAVESLGGRERAARRARGADAPGARGVPRDRLLLPGASTCAQVAAILDDPEASDNDRGVALALLRNAAIAAEGKLPMCQDTGTATIVAQEGAARLDRRRATPSTSRAASTRPTTKENLRYSQTLPLDDVRGEELRHEPAGADRPLRRRRRPLRLPLRRQGGRLGQQDRSSSRRPRRS